MVATKYSINVGDRFAKVDGTTMVWVVTRLLDVLDPIPHVQLLREGPVNRHITVSVTALSDKSLYRKL
jgi:hypothetical protein